MAPCHCTSQSSSALRSCCCSACAAAAAEPAAAAAGGRAPLLLLPNRCVHCRCAVGLLQRPQGWAGPPACCLQGRACAVAPDCANDIGCTIDGCGDGTKLQLASLGPQRSWMGRSKLPPPAGGAAQGHVQPAPCQRLHIDLHFAIESAGSVTIMATRAPALAAARATPAPLAAPVPGRQRPAASVQALHQPIQRRRLNAGSLRRDGAAAPRLQRRRGLVAVRAGPSPGPGGSWKDRQQRKVDNQIVLAVGERGRSARASGWPGLSARSTALTALSLASTSRPCTPRPCRRGPDGAGGAGAAPGRRRSGQRRRRAL